VVRRIRLAGATAASSAALIAVACGGGHTTTSSRSTATGPTTGAQTTTTTTPARPRVGDRTTARRVLAAELAAVHRSITGKWRSSRSRRGATADTCLSDKALRAGRTALVASPSYRRVKVEVMVPVSIARAAQ
jgi:hypothetical protein